MCQLCSSVSKDSVDGTRDALWFVDMLSRTQRLLYVAV